MLKNLEVWLFIHRKGESFYYSHFLSYSNNNILYRYLFWTDWSADTPCIGRSLLDGSDAKRIVQNKDGENQVVKWPNGITIDFIENRLYWVDAFLDRMTTADFDGNNVQRFIQHDVSEL
jgi:hypothetical protein